MPLFWCAVFLHPNVYVTWLKSKTILSSVRLKYIIRHHVITVALHLGRKYLDMAQNSHNAA